MRNPNLRSLLGFFLLAIGVYLFREDSGSIYGYFFSSLVVIAFWYLNNLSLALSNFRTILVFTSLFGIILLAAQWIFPANGESAKMGLSLEGGS